MKTKIILPILLIIIFLVGLLTTLARNPASESENYQLPAQVLPALAGQSTSENYGLVSTGGEPLGGGQESASESFGLRSGFWLGTESMSVPEPGLVYLPLAVRAVPCFFGPQEVEPNNSSGSANGPLCPDQTFTGTPDDTWDFFSFTTRADKTITVNVSNHPLGAVNGTQIQLYYQSISEGSLVGNDTLSPYQITHIGSAGTYYLVIYNDIAKCSLVDCSSKYTLNVTISAPPSK